MKLNELRQIIREEIRKTRLNENFKVKLKVPRVYYNVETGELADSPYEFGAKSELEDMDITNYSNGSELSDVVFSNDYETAKDFEERYPNLFKVI
jgi:hypothetical protein